MGRWSVAQDMAQHPGSARSARFAERPGAAAGVQAAARIVAVGLDERAPWAAMGGMLEEVALALDAPVAHLTRRESGGLVVLAHHGLPDGDVLVEDAETLAAVGPPLRVLDGGGPTWVQDATEAGTWLDLWDGRARSGAFVPVPDGRGLVWGCLSVEHDRRAAFDEDDTALLQGLGELVGRVLAGLERLADGRDVARRERGRRRSAEAGAQVIAAGLGSQDVGTAGRAMVAAVRGALSWPATALLRWTGTGWVVVAADGHGDGVQDLRLPHRGVLAAMYEAQRTLTGPVEPDDIVLDPATRSRLAAPVRLGGAVRYALVVESTDADGLDGSSRGDAVGVAAHMALALERLELLATEREAVTRLAEADRMRANLLAVAGHELRTPLTVVLGYAQTLREQAGNLTPEQLERASERLVDRATYLSELVDRVLLAARLESDDVDVVRRRVVLAELADGAAWATDVELGDGLEGAVMLADPDWLDRTIGFLVEHCRRKARSVVTVDARTVGDRAALMVRDDGEGIPGYERERVFRPFDGPGTAGSEVGLGPGLARGLVRAMGGELRLYSAVGYGSTFVVVLPAG